MGALGIRLEDISKMGEAIRELIEADRPAVLDAVINPNEVPASPL